MIIIIIGIRNNKLNVEIVLRMNMLNNETIICPHHPIGFIVDVITARFPKRKANTDDMVKAKTPKPMSLALVSCVNISKSLTVKNPKINATSHVYPAINCTPSFVFLTSLISSVSLTSSTVHYNSLCVITIAKSPEKPLFTSLMSINILPVLDDRYKRYKHRHFLPNIQLMYILYKCYTV